MKFVFRSLFIIVLTTAALVTIGCAKHPKPAEPVAPSPAPELTVPEMKKIVVARVNGVELTMDALVMMVNHIETINRQNAVSESPEETKTRALEQLVLQELASQEAARQELRVDEMVLDKTMDTVITNMGHEEGYNAFLEKQHITPVEMRAMVERSLLIRLIFTQEVLMKVSISEDEVRNEYETNKAKYVQQDKQMSFEEARNMIEGKLKADAQKKRREEWEQELKKDAKIELLDAEVMRKEQ